MFLTKRVGRGRELQNCCSIITESAYENRRAFRAVCLCMAMGLLFSAVVCAAPTASAQIVRMSFGEYQASAPQSSWTDGPFLSVSGGVQARDPRRSELTESIASIQAAERRKAELHSDGSVFARYVNVLTPEDVQLRLDAIAAEQERIAAAARAREAATVSNRYGTYVALNRLGVPMSQKGEVEVDKNGVPLNYKYTIVGIATAYSSDPITSTGTKPMQGTVAVDPREIPYGTRMYITSADGKYVYGYAVAEDTGGFIYYPHGATVDLFMYSESDCDQWGWRMAKIYVLD